MANKIAKFFLGENTPNGFKTFFSQQINEKDYFTYILKGGPGSGKSTIMKKIALEFSDIDDIDIYVCSADPQCFDAIVLKKSKVIIVDGTSPHIFECQYPGAYQTILNLGDSWDLEFLEQKKNEIKEIIDENNQWHSRCKKYITALASINSDIYSIGSNGLNSTKLKAFAERFIKKYIPKNKSSTGNVKYKKLSALTENGYSTQPIDYYENIFILNDPYFAGGDYFLQNITETAVLRGYDVTVSENRMFQDPVYEHILIPDLKMAFLSSNYMTQIKDTYAKPINFLRFYFDEIISAKKQRLDFSRKAAVEILAEGSNSLKNAKCVYEKIKYYYLNATDFKQIDIITGELIYNIKKRY